MCWPSQAIRQRVATALTLGILSHRSREITFPWPKHERSELVDHLNRCRDLLRIMRDPTHRQTIADLIAYLESKLAAMDGRLRVTGRYV
jgi:hypothetical protein